MKTHFPLLLAKRNRLLAFLLSVLCALPAAAHGPADYVALYKEAAKSVVGVENDFGSGSGVIISPEGHILTNAHVIYDYDYGESEHNDVFLYDWNVAEAKIIGYDLDSDIALLKIDAETPLPAVKIGDSSELQTGEPVLAIGHPRGHDYSLSTGVISSLDRFSPGPNAEITAAACSVPWIQTDAAINGGNSGGPLLNDDGEVIGIISWGDDLGDDAGLNFAVPINVAMFIQEILRDEEYVPWGILGVYAELNDLGYEVLQVNKGSGAEAAGIVPGDLIIEYNDEPVVSGYFGCVLEENEIPIKLIRDDEELILPVTLGPFEGEGRLL